MNILRETDPALNRLWDILPEARVVGGAVRDTLAGLPLADIDLASPLPPETVATRLATAGVRAIPTGIDHGTVTALIDEHPFEITTLRRDVETDGRHATVAFTDNWATDAARRDFTINAMSMDRHGAIHDYFGGRDDLAAGRVRFVGAAGQRIAEDYLRILRFFRFLARYGRGAPDAEAIAAIVAHRAGLSRLSAERVWQELKRILAATDPAATIGLMRETGVLAAVLPEAISLVRFDASLARQAPADPLLRVAAMIETDGDALADRLKLSDAERSRLAALHAAPELPPEASDTTLRRALADHPTQTLIDRSWIAPDTADRTLLRRRLAATPRPVFPLKGRDALALGAEPGPTLGTALAATRAWWLAHDFPDAATCRAELGRRLGMLEGK